jgi:hypothetical protein
MPLYCLRALMFREAVLLLLLAVVHVATGTWLAMGQDSSGGLLYSSPDGTAGSWTLRAGANLFVNQTSAAAFSLPLGRWVAVGTGGNTLAHSDDGGVTWVGQGTVVFSSSGNGVIWGAGIFLALGAGTNSMATSSDGLNWSPQGIITFTEGTKAAYSGTRW